jgi:hypothetical protein
MFIVAWPGMPPPDRADWIRILRGVLAGELGSYRILFNRAKRGRRFTLDWREDERARDEGLVARPRAARRPPAPRDDPRDPAGAGIWAPR